MNQQIEKIKTIFPILKCLSLLKQHFSVVFSLIFGAYFYCFLARILSLKTKNPQSIIG